MLTRRLRYFILLLFCIGVIFYSLPSQGIPKQELDSIQETISGLSQERTDKRRHHIIKMMRHSWHGYKQYAWGFDELLPLSKKGHNWMEHSLLFTPIDSLDTLYLMGMDQEYQEAKRLVLQHNFSVNGTINVFETTIRVLGGLLSAYELDGDPLLLRKAQSVADLMMPAYNRSLPYNALNMLTGKTEEGPISTATVGTLQLEMNYLSDLTGDPKYSNAALLAMEHLEQIPKATPGLYSKYIAGITSQFRKPITYGVAGDIDSFYEYQLKLYLALGDKRYKERYMISNNAILQHLVVESPDKEYVYVPEIIDGKQETYFNHLSCFVGGMLGLGAKTTLETNQTQTLKLAQRITETCYKSYTESSTGIGQEATIVWPFHGLQDGLQQYNLRPEVIESIFYMWRLTKDEKYRDWGWDIAERLDKICLDAAGYHAIDDEGDPSDKMESYFLAETLKYLYLLFSDDSVLPLDAYVLNTEAHPLSIRGFGRRSDPTKWVKLPPP
ncbi:glycoside hydrolase, partial [Gorgonomyces haynaldii]